MMEVGGNVIGKCPKPVVPAKITIGETYPWFPVAPGKLAEPWGITGELLFANEFVTVLRTAPREIIVARDLYSLRSVSKYVGVSDPEISFVTGSHPFQPNCGGGCTVVLLSCHSSGETNGGSATKHYTINNALPAVLKVRYIEVINSSDFGCN
jgi:hypothetical protein